jgi:hypothetical protein
MKILIVRFSCSLLFPLLCSQLLSFHALPFLWEAKFFKDTEQQTELQLHYFILEDRKTNNSELKRYEDFPLCFSFLQECNYCVFIFVLSHAHAYFIIHLWVLRKHKNK